MILGSFLILKLKINKFFIKKEISLNLTKIKLFNNKL